MERPFRFGIPLVHDGPADELREQARAAEALGYSTLQAFDQLALEPMSPVPALAFAAAVTTTIRLGAYVFDNGYRHPVLLAKEAAVLDQLSGGRLELGVGAGYSEDEYKGSGLAFPAAGERVARLEEAVALLKRLFTDAPATFSGAFYRVNGFTLPSRPVQGPWPPLMIAGARRRLLTLAGREADIVSLAVSGPGGPRESSSLEATTRKLEWVREAAGDRSEPPELEALVRVRFGASREAAAAESSARSGLAPEWLKASPHVLLGTAEDMAETLRERRRDLGISYLSVRPRLSMRDFAAVVRLLT